VITRYHDVIQAFRNSDLGSAVQAKPHIPELLEIAGVFQSQIELCDPPHHTRLRRLVKKAFLELDLDRVRRFVESFVERRVDMFGESGSADLVRDLAVPLPRETMFHLFGLEKDTDACFEKHIDNVLQFFGTAEPDTELVRAIRDGVDRLTEMTQHLGREFSSGRKDTLIGRLVAVEDAGDRLTPHEVVGNVMLLFAAGHGTTANLIGNGMLALLRNSALINRLREDPRLVGATVEEILRFDSPIQSVARTVLADTEISGTRLRKGSTVVLVLGSANRDEELFADPDHVVLERSNQHHVAFGHGIHYCVGAPLARMQAHIAIATLLRRLRMELATDTLARHESPTFRGLAALPITFQRQ
jgi:cytochrome P450